MIDLCYITMVKLGQGGWMPVNAFSSKKEATEEAEKFNNSGYRARVDCVNLELSEEAVSRIWRTRQKQLELVAMREG